jgi:hypothetical protein
MVQARTAATAKRSLTIKRSIKIPMSKLVCGQNGNYANPQWKLANCGPVRRRWVEVGKEDDRTPQGRITP